MKITVRARFIPDYDFDEMSDDDLQTADEEMADVLENFESVIKEMVGWYDEYKRQKMEYTLTVTIKKRREP